MNRANQQALYQQTNQGLLGIRQSEVNYYQNLNVAFGTQAALIGGFTYGVFTQNEINFMNKYQTEEYIADAYWIFSAITIAMSIHVILCTMLMQVLGPGLALNGPLGSMARATEGMRLEQRQIVIAFLAMMIMFSLSTVLSCWVVMSREGAIGCSVSFGIAACYWYKYCERIYLRFYWDQEEAGWTSGESSDDLYGQDDVTSPGKPLHQNAVHNSNKNNAGKDSRMAKKTKWVTKMFRRGSRSRTASNPAPPSPTPESAFQEFSGRRRVESGAAMPSGSTSSHAASAPGPGATGLTLLHPHPLHVHVHSPQQGTLLSKQHTWAIVSAQRGVLMEGYLTKQVGRQMGGYSPKRIDLRQETWERRYFTLTNAASLFVYKNRYEYRHDAQNPIFTRPLRLLDYFVEVNNSEERRRAWQAQAQETNDLCASSSSSQSTAENHQQDDASNNPLVAAAWTAEGAPKSSGRFQMTLVLRENAHEATAAQQGVVLIERSTSEFESKRYRNHWELRCDTEEELHQWVHTIREICPSCFNGPVVF